MQHIVQEIIEAYGKIDVIVNNAGVMPLSKLESLKIAEWNRMIDVNIRGVLHGIGAVLPIMKEQNSGHIVNIASIGAYEVTPLQQFIAQPSMPSVPSQKAYDRKQRIIFEQL